MRCNRDYIAELLLREIQIEKNRIGYLSELYDEGVGDAEGLRYQILEANQMINTYVKALTNHDYKRT